MTASMILRHAAKNKVSYQNKQKEVEAKRLLTAEYNKAKEQKANEERRKKIGVEQEIKWYRRQFRQKLEAGESAVVHLSDGGTYQVTKTKTTKIPHHQPLTEEEFWEEFLEENINFFLKLGVRLAMVYLVFQVVTAVPAIAALVPIVAKGAILFH